MKRRRMITDRLYVGGVFRDEFFPVQVPPHFPHRKLIGASGAIVAQPKLMLHGLQSPGVDPLRSPSWVRRRPSTSGDARR